jgi:hypothetical protein
MEQVGNSYFKEGTTMKQLMVVSAVVVASLLLLASIVLAQDFCEGNFDYDRDQDGTDAFTFKTDFGRSSIVNPCPDDGPAPVPQTGQEQYYFPWDDGWYEKGVDWPIVRFTDRGDGTVKDNLTGLIWLRNAHCFEAGDWWLALDNCQQLSSRHCGLSDGSVAGDWRLPNRSELYSLIDSRYFAPALCSTLGSGQWTEGLPFINVQNGRYWTSTNFAPSSDYAWAVIMNYGDMTYQDKYYNGNVWPVRGGH